MYTCCIFLDLTKAFDTVNHDVLLQKMENFYGFRGLPLKLMRSYVTLEQPDIFYSIVYQPGLLDPCSVLELLIHLWGDGTTFQADTAMLVIFLPRQLFFHTESASFYGSTLHCFKRHSG